MSVLDDVCREVLDGVDDGLGFAVVDLGSGLLLGNAHNVGYFTASYLDAVAAAAADMFRGRTIGAVEKLIAQQRGVPFRHLTTELQMTTEHSYHFMLVLPGKPDALAVLITGRRASLGVGWAAVRQAVPRLEAIVP